MEPNSEGWEALKAILECTQLLRTTRACPAPGTRSARTGPFTSSAALGQPTTCSTAYHFLSFNSGLVTATLRRLNRYLAHISAKTDLAKQMADNMAKMVNLQAAVAANMMADAVKL